MTYRWIEQAATDAEPHPRWTLKSLGYARMKVTKTEIFCRNSGRNIPNLQNKLRKLSNLCILTLQVRFASLLCPCGSIRRHYTVLGSILLRRQVSNAVSTSSNVLYNPELIRMGDATPITVGAGRITEGLAADGIQHEV